MSLWCSASLAALPPGLEAKMDGRTILATGCSGFFGVWTIACVQALRARGVDARIRIVGRSRARFALAHPGWATAAGVEWVDGDAQGMGGQNAGGFDYGLHMAASSDAAANAADPVGMIQSMVGGACSMARICAREEAPMLMVSSGAVYGRRAAAMPPARESDDSCAPPCLDARQAYGQAKRASETAVACQPKLQWTVSRPFAFMGPHLPLDAHFAAGNFLRDASRGLSIEIKGDGTPLRSFMHPADLAAWQLWLLCLGPRGEAVNVGSPGAVALGDLAGRIASMAGSPPPRILGIRSGVPEAYVPDVSTAGALGLRPAWQEAEAIAHCLEWLAREGGSWKAGP